MNLHRHVVTTPSPWFTLGPALWAVHSAGLEEGTVTFIQRRVSDGVVSLPGKPVLCLFTPPRAPPSLAPGDPGSFSCLRSWDHSARVLPVSSVSFHDLTAHFFLAPNNIPRSGCAVANLSIHLLKTMVVFPSLVNYEWSRCEHLCAVLCGAQFSALLGERQGACLRGRTVRVNLLLYPVPFLCV